MFFEIFVRPKIISIRLTNIPKKFTFSFIITPIEGVPSYPSINH